MAETADLQRDKPEVRSKRHERSRFFFFFLKKKKTEELKIAERQELLFLMW